MEIIKSYITSLLFFLTFLSSTQAQVIKVVEYESQTPIEKVSVYNLSKNIFLHTDQKGEVNLRVFKNADTVFFSHPDYETIRIIKKNILANGFVVEMYAPFSHLNTVVLTVSRTKKDKKDVAQHVFVLDELQVKKQAKSTTPEALELSPGIHIQRTQGGGGSPVIRGLEANRVLLVMDGIRLNNAIYRTGHQHYALMIEPTILERIELVYGPSSIYGSDALGGVIHFITKTPVINHPKQLSGHVLGRFASATEETTLHFDATFSRENWASLTAITFSDFGDIHMGTLRNHGYEEWGIVEKYSANTEDFYEENPRTNKDLNTQPNTGYRQWAVFNKTLFEFGQNAYLTLETQYGSTSDIPRFDKLTEKKNGTLKFAEWRYGPMSLLLVSPQLELKSNRKFLKTLKIIPAYQLNKESRIKRKFGSDIRSYQKEKIHVLSLNADATAEFGRGQSLSYGMEITYNKVISRAEGKKLIIQNNRVVDLEGDYYVPTRYPDAGAYYMSFAAYNNYEKKFSSKHKLNAGIRFTQTYLGAHWKNLQLVELPFQSLRLANFAITPVLSYIYSPSGWKFSVSAGSGFRSPNIDDVGKIREKKGKLLVPNIGLKPEHIYNSEIGIGKTMLKGALQIQSYAYYTLITNYISRQAFELAGFSQILYDNELVDIYANVNSGYARIFGVEWLANWQINKHVKFNTNLTYTRGIKQGGEPMPSIPPLKFFAQTSYKNDYYEVVLNFIYNAKKPLTQYDVISGIDNLDESPIDPITGEYVGFPAWHIFNAYFNLYISKHLTLNLAVENIFDVHYKKFASAVSEPGRNFKIQITGKF